MHSSFLPLMISLTLHGLAVCSIFFTALGCYQHPLWCGFYQITYLLQSQNAELNHLHSRDILQPPKGPKLYSQFILSARVQRLHSRGLILHVHGLLCMATLKLEWSKPTTNSNILLTLDGCIPNLYAKSCPPRPSCHLIRSC